MAPKRFFRKLRLYLKILGEVFYSKRDGVQESSEKIFNLWLYECVAFIVLLGGFFAIGFGADTQDGWSWQMASLFWVGPSIWSFILNAFFVFNYFAVIKRGDKDEMDLFFPKKINQLLLYNAIFGWFIAYGIYAKTMLYIHFIHLYKKDQLPWISQHDPRKERVRKIKAGRREKRKELERQLKLI